MGGKRWTYEEELTIKVWADVESTEQLAQRLGRSYTSVNTKISRLGIGRKKKISKDYSWTKEEILWLRANHNTSLQHLAKKLGRSINSVKSKAQLLDLDVKMGSSSFYWSERKIKKLKDLVDQKLEWKEISKVIGRSVDSCRSKATEMGYSRVDLKVWTTKEVKYLYEARVRGDSYKDISLALNRSYHSVRSKHQKYRKEKGL